MKKFLVRINLRKFGGVEEEFLKVIDADSINSACNEIEDLYNGEGLSNYQIIKQIFDESAYHVELSI